MIVINAKLCKGCGICIRFCPKDVLGLSAKVNSLGYLLPEVVDARACTGCRQCELYCPDFAIYVVEEGQDARG